MSGPGRLLATGRATEVYEHGPGSVLRRYREGEWFDVEREARVMALLRERDYPVPAVYEAAGTDIVMERIEGPTMLADLAKRPWRLRGHARLLADLHRRLHEIRAPEWLPQAVRAPAGVSGDRVLHVDLHPENVLITAAGPVVIDWTGASAGPPALDVALTWVIMATAAIPGGGPARAIGHAGRGAFLEAFRKRADDGEAAALVPSVAARRIELDQHLQPEEIERLRELAAG
jgi:aminoglycoside phosphotransferase (APT) family kinase protein